MNLCQYKNALGKPSEGLHSFKIFNLALVDIVLTLIAAYILHRIFDINIYKTIIFLFLFGIICHRIFCVKTTVDLLLFG